MVTPGSIGVLSRQSTLQRTFHAAFTRYAGRCAFLDFPNGKCVTYEQFGGLATAFGKGLRRTFPADIHVGVCGNNTLEWFIVEYGCLLAGLPIIALPANRSSGKQLADLIPVAKISVLICSRDMQSTVLVAAAHTPSLHVIVMPSGGTSPIDSEVSASPSRLSRQASLRSFHKFNATWETIMQAGERDSEPLPEVVGKDVFTIIFTSGSTGTPKGVVYTHDAWNADMVRYPADVLVGLSYLPTWHIVDRHHVAVTLFNGGTTGILPSADHLFDAMLALRPTVIFGVPAVFRELARRCEASTASGTSPQDTVGGGRLKTVVCGGGALADSIATTLQDQLGATVIAGYGTTEVGNISLNGKIRPNVALQVLSVPSRGFCVDDKPSGRGELCVRTSNMFAGYFNEEALTAAAFTESGYFRTGDVVEVSPIAPAEEEHEEYRTWSPGTVDSVKVIGRMKEWMKLQTGEWINPVALEASLMSNETVTAQCQFVYVHCRPGAVALYAVAIPREGTTPSSAAQLMDLFNGVLETQVRIRGVHVTEAGYTLLDPRLLNPSGKVNRWAVADNFSAALRELEARSDSENAEENMKGVLALIGLSEDPDAPVTVGDDETTTLPELGVDSMGLFRISDMLKRRHIHLPLRTLRSTPLGELRRLLQQPASTLHAAMKDPMEENERLKAQLRTLVGQTPAPSTPLADRADVVFVTGVTGFVGSALLLELLREPKMEVHCVIRANDDRQARERVVGKCVQLDPGASKVLGDAFTSRRLSLHCGDISQLQLGLPTDEYETIVGRTGHVLHCAASSNLVATFTDLFEANVMACFHVCQLAISAHATIQYISTTDVLVPPGHEEVDGPSPSADAGYAVSKWVAESLVCDVGRQAQLPTRVYRLANAGGPLHGRPECQADQFLAAFFSGVIRSGCYPSPCEGAYFPNTLPVDVIAQYVVSELRHSLGEGGVQALHLANPDKPLPLSQAFQALSRLGPTLKEVPFLEWQRAVIEDASNPLKRLWVPHETFPPLNARVVATGGLQSVVDRTGVPPPPNARLVELYHPSFLRAAAWDDSSH